MTNKQALNQFICQLSELYSEEESTAIFLTAADLSKSMYIIKKDSEADDRLENVLEELKRGKPVQYILGIAEFYDLKFKVTPDVLIPRPETEELVQWVITAAKVQFPHGKINILDIGTGSGCIPVTLQKKLPDASVSGLDISPAALDIARQNNKLNDTNVKFIEADIFAYRSPERYHIMVSNPPYITLPEKDTMHRNVVENEPHIALFVTENDPLIYYNRIADFALESLNDGGLLFFEINASYGSSVTEMLSEKGFKDILLKKDMQGMDRMVMAKSGY